MVDKEEVSEDIFLWKRLAGIKESCTFADVKKVANLDDGLGSPFSYI